MLTAARSASSGAAVWMFQHVGQASVHILLISVIMCWVFTDWWSDHILMIEVARLKLIIRKSQLRCYKNMSRVCGHCVFRDVSVVSQLEWWMNHKSIVANQFTVYFPWNWLSLPLFPLLCASDYRYDLVCRTEDKIIMSNMVCMSSTDAHFLHSVQIGRVISSVSPLAHG